MSHKEELNLTVAQLFKARHPDRIRREFIGQDHCIDYVGRGGDGFLQLCRFPDSVPMAVGWGGGISDLVYQIGYRSYSRAFFVDHLKLNYPIFFEWFIWNQDCL